MKSHDVVVIGAGPVGCYAASRLAEKGLDVLLLEKKAAAGDDVVCTGVIGVEAFDKLGLPRASIINEIRGIRFFSPSGKEVLFMPGPPQAVVVDRKKFDLSLAELAVRHGAVISINSWVRDIRVEPDQVRVFYSHSGKERKVKAKIVIIASGFGSGLTSKVGLLGPPDYLQGVQSEVVMRDVKEPWVAEVYLGRNLAPNSFVWMVPTGGRRARVGFMAKENARVWTGKFVQRPFIKSRINECRPTFRSRPIPLGAIPRSFTDRVLVVGGAAGQVKTTTGGGIYFGLICAELATETLGKAFNKLSFDAQLLGKYEERWRNMIGQEIMLGCHLRQFISKLPDSFYDMLFGIVAKDGVISRLTPLVSFDWHSKLISHFFRVLRKSKTFSRIT